jgi:hypothetical protein
MLKTIFLCLKTSRHINVFAEPIQGRASEQRGYPELALHGGCAAARQTDAVQRTILVPYPPARSEAALASRGADCQNRTMSEQGRAEEIPNTMLHRTTGKQAECLYGQLFDFDDCCRQRPVSLDVEAVEKSLK